MDSDTEKAHGERSYEDAGRIGVECGYKPRNATGYCHHQKLGERHGPDSPSRDSRKKPVVLTP